ncbi:hypothetical protein EJ07DRAFT_175498 [Lizonia empirigonia]|nr:hypothetical protein EJ07DRAFT_175498 [Lizonia empirigonia]
MSNASAGKEVTQAIANTSTADLNRIHDAANSSKEKRRELAAIKEKREQKDKEEAAKKGSGSG